MIAGVTTTFFALLVAACATQPVPLTTPQILVATITNPEFTGWFVDYCDDGRLSNELPACVQIGGEVYRVEALELRTEGVDSAARRLVIGFPAHALAPHFRAKVRLELVAAPAEFSGATDIHYIARSWEMP